MKINKFSVISALSAALITISSLLCYWGAYYEGEPLPLLFLPILFSLIFSFIFMLSGKLKLIALPVVGAFSLWFFLNSYEIFMSLSGIVNRYIFAVNDYNESVILTKLTNFIDDPTFGIVAVGFFVALIINCGVFLFKSNIIIGILPGAVIFSGIFSAVFPPMLALTAFFAGLIVCTFVRDKEVHEGQNWLFIRKRDRVYKTALISGIFALVIAYVLSGPVTETAFEHMDMLRDTQDGIIRYGASQSNAQTAELSNTEPPFTGQTVMELKSSSKPMDVLYLKDGAFGDYTGKAFKKLPIRELLTFIDKNTGEASPRFIFDRPYQTLFPVMGEPETLKVTLYGDTRPVLPYYSLMPGVASPVGDGYISSSFDELTFRFFNGAPMGDMFSVNSFPYDRFVADNYMKYSPLPSVDKLVAAYPGSLDKTDPLIPDFAAIKYIAEVLSREYTYSLDTPKLDGNADFVDNFLSKQKEGFCQHFASSAVLMLRSMGYPARYATGYAVSPSLFEKSGDVFTARVPDYLSHAWVEIYYREFGWIVFDPTPGGVSPQADIVRASFEASAPTVGGATPEPQEDTSRANDDMPTPQPGGQENTYDPVDSFFQILLNVSWILFYTLTALLPIIIILVRRRIVRGLRYRNYKQLLASLISLFEFCLGTKQGSLTDTQYLKLCFDKIKLEGADKLTETAERLLYSGEAPKDEDMNLIVRMYDRAALKMRSRLSLQKKLLYELLYCF